MEKHAMRFGLNRIVDVRSLRCVGHRGLSGGVVMRDVTPIALAPSGEIPDASQSIRYLTLTWTSALRTSALLASHRPEHHQGDLLGHVLERCLHRHADAHRLGLAARDVGGA